TVLRSPSREVRPPRWPWLQGEFILLPSGRKRRTRAAGRKRAEANPPLAARAGEAAKHQKGRGAGKQAGLGTATVPRGAVRGWCGGPAQRGPAARTPGPPTHRPGAGTYRAFRRADGVGVTLPNRGGGA